MKKLILIVILTASYTFTYSQQKALSLANTGLFVGQSFRLLAAPKIAFKNENKSWSIGPTIILHSENTASDNSYPKLSGLSVSYMHYHFEKTNKINFYFIATSNFQLISNKWKSQIWNEETASYQSHKYKNDELLITQHFGYGFTYRLTDNLALSQNVGFGGYYSGTDNNEESAGAPEIGDTNLSGYNKFGFSWALNLEFTYSL